MFKIGRNEPCTCGSGKKYKRCCGDLSRENERKPSKIAFVKPSKRTTQGDNITHLHKKIK